MENPYQSPQESSEPPRAPGEGDATGGVIPYKNMPALLAYYLGLLSLVTCILPIPLGIVPVVLGIIGLRKRARQPEVRGSAHAWIGILVGGFTALCCFALYVMIAIAVIADM